MPLVDLSTRELEILSSALDSHKYWQLADDKYKSSGYVLEPGSDDEEAAEEIAEVEVLESKLEGILRPPTAPAPEKGPAKPERPKAKPLKKAKARS